jgi:uncharacterized protein YjdB
MARSKSIILSKDEKKAVVTDLKSKIAAAKAATKEISGALKASAKDHAAFVKVHEKTLAGLTKELASHTAQLTALTAKTL